MAFPDETHLTTLATLKGWLDSPPVGGVSAIAPASVGSGYTSTPTVTITDAPGGSGTGATATAVVVGNQVTSYVITAKGQNYSSPQVVISGGGGSGASATAAIGADAYLSRLITAASSLIVQATNIPTIFDSGANITERRNGNGQSRMTMRVSPIISVASVTIGTSSIVASDGTSSGYLFADGILYLIGYCFTAGVQNVTIVYRAGEVAGSQVQLMLEQACLVVAALWWKRRPYVAETSISAPGGVGTLNFSQKDLPPEAWTVIRQIQRVAPVV